jgi:Caspase domain
LIVVSFDRCDSRRSSERRRKYSADGHTCGVQDMTARLVGILTILFVYFFAWGSCAVADKRVALVIGNSDYGTQMRLLNPRNDAQDVAESLKLLGFEVILRVDADKQAFLQAMAEFARAVTGADIGLFFYAGHGMQYYGSNYLVPVRAQLQDEVSVRFELIALDEIQRALERTAGVRILVLDACRNNPLAAELTRSMRTANRDPSISRGLARIEQARGTVVAYATQANEIAEDGASRNSPFTGALLESLRVPGLEIGTMFRRVATRVYETTHGKQIPELSISLLSDVFLNRNETDAQIWSRVRGANDPAGVRDFLERFPNSFYAADARLRLDMLEREAKAKQLDRERTERERELRDRLAALEVERLQAEMNLRAAARAAQDANERLRQEQTERERLAAEVIEKQRAVADVTEQLRAESARRSRISAEATDRERELRTRLTALELASQKAAADLAARARTSAAEATSKDQQIATIELARRDAEARVAALTQQAQALTTQAGKGEAGRTPPLPPPLTREPQGQQMAAINPDKPPASNDGQLVFAIKTELNRLGCYFAPIDLNWQAPTLRKAITDFAVRTHRAKVPDGPTQEFLEDLKARSGRICTPSCGPRERESNGQCVAKTCPSSEVLDRDGNCVPRDQPKPARPAIANSAPRPHRIEPPATSRAGRGNCFNFNGRQFCE